MLRKILDWLTSRQQTRSSPAAGRQDRAIQAGKVRGKAAAGQCGGVSLITGSPCCAAAAKLAGKRMLMSEAPALPLPDCTHHSCRCRFDKHRDRRDGEDRRLAGMLQTSAWYGGSEKRGSKGRRSDDS